MDGEIPATELASALDDEEPLVVESDSLGRSGASGFPGANIPLSALPAQIERLTGATHVVTVCPHGGGECPTQARPARLHRSEPPADRRDPLPS